MTDKKIFQVQGYLSGFKTLSNALRITVDTMENVSGESIKRFMDMMNQPGWFTFNVHQVEAEDIVDLPPVKTDSKKTPSQRMRSVMWLLFMQDPEGHENFETYYNTKMDKWIEKLKERLA